MVVRIHAEIGDEGDHSFDFCCRNEDGKTIGDTLKGSFAVEGAPQGVQNLVLMINLGFPKAGRYVFVLRIDNSIADEWPLSVRKSEKPQPEQQKPK